MNGMNCTFTGQFFFEHRSAHAAANRVVFGVANRNGSSTQGQEGLTSSPFIPDNTPLKPLAWIRALLLFSPP